MKINTVFALAGLTFFSGQAMDRESVEHYKITFWNDTERIVIIENVRIYPRTEVTLSLPKDKPFAVHKENVSLFLSQGQELTFRGNRVPLPDNKKEEAKNKVTVSFLLYARDNAFSIPEASDIGFYKYLIN